MKLLRYIIICIAAFAGLMACSDVVEPLPGLSTGNNSDGIEIDISLSVADMPMVQSRVQGDAPDYANLHLYVVEFDGKGSPLDGNMLTHIYTPNEETLNADGDIHFKLMLIKSEEPRVLHLIAVPKDVSLEIPYGLEGAVIPSLRVHGGTDAYWQRVVFPDGYGRQDGSTWIDVPDLRMKLTHVPMIRNFAKVTMTSSASDFTLEGFEVYNRAEQGTIAPWNSTSMEFPAFTGSDDRPLSYAQMDYEGIFPGGDILNQADAATGTPLYDSNAKYLYERPETSVRNTVVVMKGRRRSDTASSYYKIDIGKNDADKIFNYYNVLRNFEYAINITSVNAKGYATVQEALSGVVYNNFSFNVDTRQMLNVSDGDNMMWVNNVTFVVNDPDNTTVVFRYMFRKDISGANILANDDVRFRNLVTGEAITDISISDTDTADGWREVIMTTQVPTGNRKEQEFIIFDPESGLGRTISVIVRNPWEYKEIELWGGNYNTREQYLEAVQNHSKWQGHVQSGTVGAPMTVFFTIDNNIPESMFPLTFILEAKQQNVENNKIVGNLNVISEPSYYDNTKTAIKYVKTVTWTDYNSYLSDINFTGTAFYDEYGNLQRRIRCRLITINSVGVNETLNIRVYNPYMRVSGSETPTYVDLMATGMYAGNDTPPNWKVGDKDCPAPMH